VGGERNADEGEGTVVSGLLAGGGKEDVGGVRLGDGVEGRIAVMTEAVDGPRMFFVFAVDSAAPEDAVGGAEHDAPSGLEEDVG
jgi:hypothetical protein